MLEINQIHQGDCLELMKNIPYKSVDLILCDLPYELTQNTWDKSLNLKSLFKQYWTLLKEKGIIVLTASQPFTTLLINAEFENFRYDLIWEKSKSTGFLNAKKMPLRSHESVLIFYKKCGTYNPQKIKRNPYNKGLRKKQTSEDNYGQFSQTIVKSPDGLRYPRSVMYFKTAESERNTYHKTQKPLSLFKWIIKTYTNKGDLVLDNCIGSGTTAVACKQTNRNFIGIEKEKAYVEIAERRLSQNTLSEVSGNSPHN